MEEKTFVNELFSNTAGNLNAATRVVCGPAERIYEHLEETRFYLKRHLAEMLGLRASKIRPYRRQLKFV